jgi:hypothetical protein
LAHRRRRRPRSCRKRRPAPRRNPAFQAARWWTDRCVICQRDRGVTACSNIGIACQPQALLCLRADAVEDKKPAN